MPTANLIRIDVSGVKSNVYKTAYTVPTGKTFILSGVWTTSVDNVSIKIGNIVVSDSLSETNRQFKGFIVDENEVIQITHTFSDKTEYMCLCGELFDK